MIEVLQNSLRVPVQGNLWSATSSQALRKGTTVSVLGLHGLQLEVEEWDPNSEHGQNARMQQHFIFRGHGQALRKTELKLREYTKLACEGVYNFKTKDIYERHTVI